MPDPSLTITVLLASPGDIRAERKAVREAVEEINRVHGEDAGYQLVVKGWETHSRPAAGRAQGVINRQIGATDIFLGIMWHRVGTATGKARSGTIEEYERARQRHKRSKAKLKPSVMFYFRSTLPRSGVGFDPDQYKEVLAFKKRVFKDNLAREYAGPKEFARLVREHLTVEARAIARSTSSSGRKARAVPTPSKSTTPRSAPKKRKRRPTPRQFAHSAFRSVRARFERQAKAASRVRPSIGVSIQREGDSAFTATVTSYDAVRARARVAVANDDGRWALLYQRGESHSFYGANPGYRTELRVHVADRDGTRGFEQTARQSWQVAEGLDQSPEVAQAFWERLTHGII